MAKTMAEVQTIVMKYPADPRNKWLTDPNGDPNAAISPTLADMPGTDFIAFFADFTQYIRVDNGMSDIVMTATGLKSCPDWASLILYVFNLQ